MGRTIGTTWAVLAVVAATGCGPDFLGEDQVLGFDTTLSRPWASFSPETPVALGSSMRFEVTTQVLDPATEDYVAPQALPSVEDPALLTDLDLAPDALGAVAAAEGDTRVHFDGDLASDAFPLHVAAAAGAGLTDPIHFRDLVQVLEPEWLQGGPWADVASSFLLASGAQLFLDVDLRDAGDGRLAFAPGLVEVAAQGDGPAATAAGQGVLFDAGAVDGGVTEGTLRVGGADLGAFTVEAVAPADVATLDLAAARVDDHPFVLKVTARRADGAVVWQPPVDWEVPEGFSVADQASQGLTPVRTDLLVLTWEGLPEEPPGPMQRTVAAVLGELRVEAVLEVDNPEPRPVDEEVPPTPAPAAVSGCGCAAAGGRPSPFGAALLALGLVALRPARRVRRGR